MRILVWERFVIGFKEEIGDIEEDEVFSGGVGMELEIG